MLSLNILDANDPRFAKELETLVTTARYANNRPDSRVFVFFTAGMKQDEIDATVIPLPFGTPQFHQTNYPSTVSMLVRDAQTAGRAVHVIVGKPVRYEPSASVYSFGGLPIPAVFDEELGPVLAVADIVTICVESHK